MATPTHLDTFGHLDTAILELLASGCRIVLPSKHYLQGDPDTGYIAIGQEEVGPLGIWPLDKSGVRCALRDRDMQPAQVTRSR